MSVRNYRDLIVWQKAMELVVEVYRITRQFPKEELYGLTSQLRRCAVSIPSNIAEGRGRYSRKEYLRFLSIANGSLCEAETQIFIAERLDYVTREVSQQLLARSTEVTRLLHGLHASLSSKSDP